MHKTATPIICLIALLVWSRPAWAERELEFAKGLMDKGFYDLAAEQYQLLETSKEAPEGDRAQATLQLADCYSKAADVAAKPEVRDEFLGKAADQLDKFVKTYKGRPEVGEARYRMAILLQTRGQDKDKLIKLTQDTKLQEKLKEEAAKLFTEAANTFGDVADELEAKAKKGPKYVRPENVDPKEQEIVNRYLLARAQLGWTYYFLSQVYSHDPKDKDKMKKNLMEAQNVFQPFMKEYPSYFVTLWVQCGQGLVYRGLGDLQKAAEEFQRVTRKRRSEEANPTRYQAYFLLAETQRLAAENLQEAKKHDDSVRMYDDSIRNANRFLQEVPENFGEPIGQAIKLERAKSYAEQAVVYKIQKKTKEAAANYTQALKITDELVKAGGPFASEAAIWRTKWQQEAGLKPPKEAHPPAADKFAEGANAMNEAKSATEKADKKLAVQKYETAIKAFRLAVEYADPDNEGAMAAESWYNIGQCYYFLGLLAGKDPDPLYLYEAGLAFGELANRYPENERAPKAAYLNTVFLGQLYQTTQGNREYEADLYLNSLISFVEKYPKEPQSEKLAFQVGDVLWKQKRFTKAAEIYANIPTFSQYYERAAYMAGNSYWVGFLEVVKQDAAKAKSEEGQRLLERAIGRLTEFVDWAGKQPFINAEKEKEKKHWMAQSRVRLATIYTDEFVQQPQKAIDILKDFETLYPDEQKSFPEVACLRVQAQAWIGELPKALEQMKNLLEKYGTHDAKAVSKVCRTVGMACANVAEKPPAGMKPADVEAYRNNAIFYLKLSLEKDPEQPFAEYSRIADKLMGFKDYADAAQIYVNGMKKYQAEIGPTPVWWGTLAKVGECYFNLGQWKPALEVYKQLDEHVKKDPNKALLYKENLGLCYENLALSYEEQAISQKDPQEKEKALAEARNLWQKALSEAWNILNDKLPQGTPKCFEAKIHQIHCFVKLGDDVSAWKNFAQQTLFAWPDMGGPDIKKQFMELLDKDLPTHKQEFEDMVKKLEGKK